MSRLLHAGTYTIVHVSGGYIDDAGYWNCTVTFDGLEVTEHGWSRKKAFNRAHRAMAKAVKLRSAILDGSLCSVVRSIQGLCDE